MLIKQIQHSYRYFDDRILSAATGHTGALQSIYSKLLDLSIAAPRKQCQHVFYSLFLCVTCSDLDYFLFFLLTIHYAFCKSNTF
jgi:hypothetical protein